MRVTFAKRNLKFSYEPAPPFFESWICDTENNSCHIKFCKFPCPNMSYRYLPRQLKTTIIIHGNKFNDYVVSGKINECFNKRIVKDLPFYSDCLVFPREIQYPEVTMAYTPRAWLNIFKSLNNYHSLATVCSLSPWQHTRQRKAISFTRKRYQPRELSHVISSLPELKVRLGRAPDP